MPRTDPQAARRHLETTADLVVVHDVMAEAINQLWGIYARASLDHERGSADHMWLRGQARAVRDFQDSIDTRDREAMLRALDIVQLEIERFRLQASVA